MREEYYRELRYLFFATKQGMSDIAGMLLIYVADEEEAFWALAQLLNGPRHKMHCLFTNDFPGLTRYFKHHEKVLQTHLRKVWKHFKKLDVDACTYAFKWYMQCFLGRVSPFDVSVVVSGPACRMQIFWF